MVAGADRLVMIGMALQIEEQPIQVSLEAPDGLGIDGSPFSAPRIDHGRRPLLGPSSFEQGGESCLHLLEIVSPDRV